MPRHSPIPRPPHPPQLRQNTQCPKLPQHLLQQPLSRRPRLRRRRPHKTRRTPLRRILTRPRTLRRTRITSVRIRQASTSATWTGEVGRGGTTTTAGASAGRGWEGRGGSAGRAYGADPEEVYGYDDGTGFWVGDGVRDAVGCLVGFATFDEEARDEGGAELRCRVGVVEAVGEDYAPGFVCHVD